MIRFNYENESFLKKSNNIKMGGKLLFSHFIVVFLPALLVGLVMSFNYETNGNRQGYEVSNYKCRWNIF